MTYNVSTKETETLKEFNQLYYSIEFNPDASAVLIEQDSCLYYLDLADDESNKKKILDSYDFIKIKRMGKERVSIIYNQESVSY